jgi:hypothetical protein
MTVEYFFSLNSYLIEKTVDAQLFPQRQRVAQQKTVSSSVATVVTTDYYRLVTMQITVDNYRLRAIIIECCSRLLSNIISLAVTYSVAHTKRNN